MINSIARHSNIELIVAFLLISLLLVSGCSARDDNKQGHTRTEKSTGSIVLPPPLRNTAIDSESLMAWMIISGEDQSSVQRDAMVIANGVATFEKSDLKPGIYNFTVEFEQSYLSDTGVLNTSKVVAASISNVSLGVGENSLEFSVSDYQYPDDDADGVYNIKELELNTDPTDPNSKPAISCDVVSGDIVCSDITYVIGGKVLGLSGAGLTLQNNGSDKLEIPAFDTQFNFIKALISGDGYDVSVQTQPNNQFCFVNNGTGVVGAQDIDNVQIVCADAYDIGGVVHGLTGTMVLDNNGERTTIVNSDSRINAPFVFNTSLPSGQSYNVAVVSQPENLFCTALNSGGIVAENNISNVIVNCLPEVKPHYQINGAGWARYVTNDGATNYQASGAACSSASAGYASCVHGGEIYSIAVHGLTNCNNVSAVDELALFDWLCDDSTNPVTVASTGLKQGVRLSHLIDFSGSVPIWKNNKLTINVSDNIHGVTPTSRWLAAYSPIVLANNGLTSGAANPGNVYVVTTNAKSSYTLDRDNVALVVRPGIRLSGPGTGVKVIEAASTANFIWLEGDIDSVGDGGVVINANHSVIENLIVRNATGVGIAIGGSNSLVKNVKAATNGSASFSGNDGLVTLQGSANNQFLNIFSTNNKYMGIRSQGVNETWINVLSANNNRGFVFEGHDNRYISVTSNNNVNEGITFGGAAGLPGNSVMINATSVNNGYLGVDINNRFEIKVMNLAATANATDTTGYGVFVNSSNPLFINTVVANNGGIGYLGSSTSFSGILYYGSNNDATCFGCETTPTDPVITYDVDISTSFVAEIGNNDVINATAQIAGGAQYENIIDWLNFENRFRAWGGSHVQPFPDLGDRKNCRAGNTCVIWDWSLSVDDLGNAGLPVLNNVLAHPTNLAAGKQIIKQTWSVQNQQDCNAIQGAIWEVNTCYSLFLRNAIEIVNDYDGNENGLCESNETCLFSPNIASYQGHGDLISAGSFDGVELTGIILMQYSNNGY